ncbi:MAG: cheA, partial [Verrucomicrobiales bacterium]|nr:cheA [Verrucomicrobiales bacterium]
IYSLIFAPGFSTAERVTDLSGRGVGMDVVRRNIDKMRGKIEISTLEGKGTTFTISLPLTLAIIDGLIVQVGHHRYIIPTLSIRESFRPEPDQIFTLQEKGEMISVRDQIIPLLRLSDFFGVTTSITNPAEAIVLVVESSNERRCIMVDRLLGKQEVVIKSLGETFQSNDALAGAAILGDGLVGLIVDADALVHLNKRQYAHAA